MRRCDSGVIVFLVIGAVFGQQAKTPQKGSDLSILPGYNLVEWPTQATSAAGFRRAHGISFRSRPPLYRPVAISWCFIVAPIP